MSDDWLRSELEALEARHQPTSQANRPRRSRLPLIAAATGGALLIAAAFIALPNLLRPTAVEPSQSASFAASPSVAASLPETPAATTANPSPTPEPQLGTSWTPTAAFSPAGIDVDPMDLAGRDDLVVAVGYALLEQEAPKHSCASRRPRMDFCRRPTVGGHRSPCGIRGRNPGSSCRSTRRRVPGLWSHRRSAARHRSQRGLAIGGRPQLAADRYRSAARASFVEPCSWPERLRLMWHAVRHGTPRGLVLRRRCQLGTGSGLSRLWHRVGT